MEPQINHEHHAIRHRTPLGDTTNRAANSHPTYHTETSQLYSGEQIPHHESLKPGGQLQSPEGVKTRPPTDPRLSAVVSDDQDESNRNSQISTTSTNASGKSRRKTHIGPWRLGKTLGRGSCGRVRLAKHELTGQMAAIKIVSKLSATLIRSASLANDKMRAAANDDDETRKLPLGIEREVVIMKLIDHPNVIKLYDVWENRKELYV